ncbi:hypothetical protein ACFXJ8_16560 [Nonomuraea sp. NPDC059194]|uniref:hypothetical protein n=1 Tax=Nonomuraea sp. NPDC059194 TaxID=3346764 RepID=UPI0036B717A6
MRTSRTILIAVTAGLLTAAASATAASAAASTDSPTTWGPLRAQGDRAVTGGTLTVVARDKSTNPMTATVHVKGKITDLTNSKGCGWTVFRISYLKSDGSVPSKHRYYLDCSKGTPKKFAFTDHRVVLVEVKVCNEGKAKEPSLNCYYAGSWKNLYSYLQ